MIAEIARSLSAAALGVFAGAMLAEGLVLVPYWRSLAPREFHAWYAANDRRLVGFFGPLTSATALLAVAAALVSLWEGHPGRWFAVAAAALSVAVVATFFIYFQRANASFAEAPLGADEAGAELGRWATWHWWRTAMSFVALAAAMAARG